MTDNLSSQGITTYTYDADRADGRASPASYGGTAGPQVDYTYDAPIG